MSEPAENASAHAEVPPTSGEGGAAAGGAEGAGTGESKGNSDHLNLKVKSQDGNEVFFKVKRTTQFSKVMTAYCKKVGAEAESVRFLFDGTRIRPDQTPAELDMEDEDEIDAMVSQTGGF